MAPGRARWRITWGSGREDAQPSSPVRSAIASRCTRLLRFGNFKPKIIPLPPDGTPEALADLSLRQREIICPAGSGLSNRAMPPLSISSMTDGISARYALVDAAP